MHFTASIGVRIALLDKPDLSVRDVVVTTRTEPVDGRLMAQQEASLALLNIHEQLDARLDADTMRLVGSGIVQILASLRQILGAARDGQLLYSDQNDTHEMTTSVYFSATGKD
jgi:hypothetical protein